MVNGTLMWYYYICKREVWLIGHGIEADQANEFLLLGRHIQELFYKREKKEFLIDNTIAIDILPQKKVVGEIKKSSRYEKAAKMQLAFYLWYMKQKGVELEGELRIPQERKKQKVHLTPQLEREIEEAIADIQKVLSLPKPPPPVKIPYCKHCAYKDLCWS